MRTFKDPYRLAVYILNHGGTIPVDLAATLIEFGHNVKRIEEAHGR